jgi:two-component system response regulator GlrR
VAHCDASVLIGGETGTGKEMVARAVHYLSLRNGKPFVPVNCGAIPADLVENELFGHEAGAFTGASSSSTGMIRDAEGGVIFLDEIDSLPLASQVKLLRFLQEKEYRPLGSRKTLRADVRVISASNANFEEAIRNGKFRSDLYYRLHVVPLAVPALRERKEDIPLLARHLLAKYSKEYDLPLKSLSNEALRKLILYGWPGNVRELENVIEHALILSEQPCIMANDIDLPSAQQEAVRDSFKTLKAKAIADFETHYIQDVLFASNGNIAQAAKAAKKHRRAFWELIQKHRINVHGGFAPSVEV